jgi:hypothetical protein
MLVSTRKVAWAESALPWSQVNGRRSYSRRSDLVVRGGRADVCQRSGLPPEQPTTVDHGECGRAPRLLSRANRYRRLSRSITTSVVDHAPWVVIRAFLRQAPRDCLVRLLIGQNLFHLVVSDWRVVDALAHSDPIRVNESAAACQKADALMLDRGARPPAGSECEDLSGSGLG